jgi:hypothetical protein
MPIPVYVCHCLYVSIYMNSCMTKMLAGHYCAEQGVEMTSYLIKLAEDRLINDFAFVGLTERWDESICLFHQMLGGIAREVEFENVRQAPATKTNTTNMLMMMNGSVIKTATPFTSSTTTATTTTPMSSSSCHQPLQVTMGYYDVRVLEGLNDTIDEHIYEVNICVFILPI